MNGCPYCGARWRGRDARQTFRVHAAVNECGQVPLGTCVPFAKGDPAGETSHLLPVVERCAEAHGWRVCHVYPARGRDGRWITATSSPGFPDVWMVRPGQLLVYELKSRGGRPGPGQREWIADLATVPGVTATFAGPDDWPAVQAALQAPTLDAERQPG